MANKQSGKGKRRVPKTVLRLPDLDQAKPAVLNSLSSIDAQRGYRHAIEEFIELNGTARSRDSRSARPSSSAIVSTWSLDISRPAPSTFASAQCAASPTRRPIVVC
jgi:hypothetical protein